MANQNHRASSHDCHKNESVGESGFRDGVEDKVFSCDDENEADDPKGTDPAVSHHLENPLPRASAGQAVKGVRQTVQMKTARQQGQEPEDDPEDDRPGEEE